MIILFTGGTEFSGKLFFDWYVDRSGYAVTFEGYLAEFCALNGDARKLLSGIEKAFLPEKFPQLAFLLDDDWQITGLNVEPDCWHGENVMICDLKKSPENLFYSLVDKF